jgi:hypothetical protein
MTKVKIAPVTVTVTFTVDEVTSVWEGRSDSPLAGLNAGFVNVASAEIVSVEAATVGGEALVATGKVGKGRDYGRMSFAVEIPKTAKANAVSSTKNNRGKSTRGKAKAAAAAAVPLPEPVPTAPTAVPLPEATSDLEARMARMEALNSDLARNQAEIVDLIKGLRK